MHQTDLFENTENPFHLSDEEQHQLLIDLFQAYYDARKNKRNTRQALEFEWDYESRIFGLHDEIVNGNYAIQPSQCFISFDPVQREIFAARFRDRIVHHLIYNYISPIFEKKFIHDSYSCRKGKGTLYGIKRVQRFIRACSHNYKKECYILKLDIKGYFMSMNRSLLFRKVKDGVEKHAELDSDFNRYLSVLLYLLEKVIFNDPTKNCDIKGSFHHWSGLPPSKSLFHSKKDSGFPIGNLTSQLFSNIYLNDLDHYIKRDLNIKYYGRYVDDFVIIHQDSNHLKSIIPEIRRFMKEHLLLELHPDKIYLQHFTKGVRFLGSIIKPHRIYIQNRTKGNFYHRINKLNDNFEANTCIDISMDTIRQCLSRINSYLGLIIHYNTYKLRKKILTEHISFLFWKYFFIGKRYHKICKRI